MPIPQAQLDNWFQHHLLDPDQIVSVNDIRLAAKIFAETVNKHVPDGADKSAAMRLIREAMMTSNAGIACYVDPPQSA